MRSTIHVLLLVYFHSGTTSNEFYSDEETLQIKLNLPRSENKCLETKTWKNALHWLFLHVGCPKLCSNITNSKMHHLTFYFSHHSFCRTLSPPWARSVPRAQSPREEWCARWSPAHTETCMRSSAAWPRFGQIQWAHRIHPNSTRLGSLWTLVHWPGWSCCLFQTQTSSKNISLLMFIVTSYSINN